MRKDGTYVLGKSKIRKWLETQDTFGLHRQINRKFRRRRVIAPHINYQWDLDTAVLKSYTKDNDGYGYFVTEIPQGNVNERRLAFDDGGRFPS